MNPKSLQQKHFCLKGETSGYRATQGVSKTNEVAHFHRSQFLACVNCNTTSSTIVTKHFWVQLSGTWETSVMCWPFTSPSRRTALPERWWLQFHCLVIMYWLIDLLCFYFYYFLILILYLFLIILIFIMLGEEVSYFSFILSYICIRQGVGSRRWGQEPWRELHRLPAGGVAQHPYPPKTIWVAEPLCPGKWGWLLDPDSLFYIRLV